MGSIPRAGLPGRGWSVSYTAPPRARVSWWLLLPPGTGQTPHPQFRTNLHGFAWMTVWVSGLRVGGDSRGCLGGTSARATGVPLP